MTKRIWCAVYLVFMSIAIVATANEEETKPRTSVKNKTIENETITVEDGWSIGSDKKTAEYRVGSGGRIVNAPDQGGIEIHKLGALSFDKGSSYTGGGGIASSGRIEIRANIDGQDGETGRGTRELFADTTLGKGAEIVIGGDDFTQDLILKKDSQDGFVRIDDDAVFHGRLDLGEIRNGNALVIAGEETETSARIQTEFRRDVTAHTVGIHNAAVTIRDGVTVKTDQLTAGENSLVHVTGDATLDGNAVFGTGSTLKLGTNTFSIEGDATFENGSVYDATLGERNTSHLKIRDTAEIKDGAMVYLGGIAPEKAGSTTILTAGTLRGELFQSSLYELERGKDNSIVVTGVRKTADVVGVDDEAYSGNTNIKNAAELYDRITRDTSISQEYREELLSALDKATTLRKTNERAGDVAIAQVLGQHATHAGEHTLDTARAFQGGIGNRLTVIHQARNGGGSLGAVQSGEAFASFDSGYYDGPAVIDTMDRLWVGGFGSWAKQDNHKGQFGYHYDSYGAIAGYDWERGDFTFGASVAFSRGDMDNNDGYTKTDVDTMNVGLYASYDPVSGIFVDANAGYGRSWNKSSTTLLTGGSKHGNFSNSAFHAGLNAGYTFERAEWRITPTLGIQWTRVDQDGWTESGTENSLINNWFGASSSNYVEVPVAVRLSRSFQLDCGIVLTPEARAAYIANIGESEPTVRMGYVGSSESTTLHGIDPGRGRGLIGGGVKANFSHNLDAYLDYNLEFRNGYRNNNLTGGVGVSF